MKFSVGEIEYEGQWGGDWEKKEFNTLEELTEFIKQVLDEDKYIYRFVIYDKLDDDGCSGFISIAPDED